LCIGWIGFASFHNEEGFALYERVLTQQKPAVVQFFAPAISRHPTTGKSNVEMAKEFGNVKVLLQVGNVKEGIEAIASGADGIIAQGSEAGGHGLRREFGNGTLPLAARLVKLAAEAPHKPLVLAAGGIADGRGVAAALALGCDGAVLGTRLWASKEALNKDTLKQALVAAKSGDDVQRTRVFDQILNVNMNPPWPAPYDSVGALRNETSETWDGKALELDRELAMEGSSLLNDYLAASQKGDTSQAQVLAGEGVGEINAIESAYDIVLNVDQEARDVIDRLSKLL
jgi:nitronate monooxygenase